MAVLQTLARRAAKTVFFIASSIAVGRTLGPPENWVSIDFVHQLGRAIYGPGDIGADNFWDLMFYIDFLTVISITTVIHIVTMKLITKIRKK
ncbi:hypothetical protein [Mangrovibacter phragmitis]|uniref:hypothetical protein n=1 Tax=Mangrovibacter phragmitis TaxID=1691903 RepID=UPI00336AB1C7